MEFTNHKNKLERPFMFYADTESTLKKTDDDKKIHEHIVNSCCFYFVCTFDSSRNKLYTYEGENCLKEMTQKMFDIAEKCIKEMMINKNMIFTQENRDDYYNATHCYLCKDEFVEAPTLRG